MNRESRSAITPFIGQPGPKKSSQELEDESEMVNATSTLPVTAFSVQPTEESMVMESLLQNLCTLWNNSILDYLNMVLVLMPKYLILTLRMNARVNMICTPRSKVCPSKFYSL